MLLSLTFFLVPAQPIFEPRCEKIGLRGFQPGLTQTGVNSHRRYGQRLEISDIGSRGIVLSV